MKKTLNNTMYIIVGLLVLVPIVYVAFKGDIKQYNILSLVPPMITIILAFLTKQTLLSMFAGIWMGTTLMIGGNPVKGVMHSITDYLIPQISDSWNAGMLLLISCIGGFMYMMSACGGSEAFGRWVKKHANTRKKVLLMAWIAPFAFLYDQGCLIVGIIMRPVTDKMNISRVKLAYITDSMSAPLVSMSPINDYGIYLVGLIAAGISLHGISDSAYSLYFHTFAFNLYAVGAIITVLVVILLDLDMGPMYEAEERAINTGKTFGENDKLVFQPPEEQSFDDSNISMANFLVPIISLWITVVLTIFYTGEIFKNGFLNSFSNCDIQLSIILGFLVATVVAFIFAIIRCKSNLEENIIQWINGAASMFQVLAILVLAWSISSVTSDMGIGEYLAGLLSNNFPIFTVPMIMFLIGVLMSFATGSSWGVWAIGIPIAFSVATTMDLSIPLLIGAIVSGGLFGDNCSPISDTTIQASTSASCDHMQHVNTQLPYACTVGGSAAVGYLMAGIIGEAFALPVTIVITVAILYFLHIRRKQKNCRG